MDQLKYNLLSRKYLPRTINCVTKVFLYDEPMTCSLGMSEFDFQIFSRVICERAVNEKRSYICTRGDDVVGFALNEDLMAEPIPESAGIPSAMSPILSLLEGLDKNYLKGKRVSKGELFHLFMIGSLREHRNQGIVRKLIDKSLALAKRQGFGKVVTEATNMKSQNLFRTYFGFKDAINTPYGRYKFQSQRPFKDIGELSCNLMELKLR